MMKRNKIRLTNILFKTMLLTGAIAFSLSGNAQEHRAHGYYVLNPMLINPAYAGSNEALNLAGYFRQQWVGMEGAPGGTGFSADFPALKNKLGLGFMYFNESYGVNHDHYFNSMYAYRIKMKNGSLAFGLGAGFISSRTRWSELNTTAPGDEGYLLDTKAFLLPSFSVGAKFSYNGFFTGISVPSLLSYTFNYNESKYEFSSDPDFYPYTLFAGNRFQLSSQAGLQVSGLMEYSKKEGFHYEAFAIASFSEKIWLGTGYSSRNTLTGLLQFAFTPQLKAGYMYHFDLGKISYASKGSHELTLRYEFRYKASVASPLMF